MGVSGYERKVPEVWGQSQWSSDVCAHKAAEIADDPNIEDALEKHSILTVPVVKTGDDTTLVDDIRKPVWGIIFLNKYHNHTSQVPGLY